MANFKHKFMTLCNMIANSNFKDISLTIKRRLYSNTYWYFVRRDLHLGLNGAIPEAKIDITLRPYKDSDHVHFDNLPLDDMLLKANIATCYVAVTKDDIPCFREWLIEPSQNDKIKSFFGHNFPRLEADQCIFERAYAPKAYRGLNLHPAVNYLFAKKALELGYRWVVSIIDLNNMASLKMMHKLDTYPYKLHITKRRFFTKKTVYMDIPEKLKAKTPWLFPKEAD